ncbi:MAG: hypothetical protein IKU55_06345 [Clostridia bacterium]|nr:hypothetical protein [Clostridia bacterium]
MKLAKRVLLILLCFLTLVPPTYAAVETDRELTEIEALYADVLSRYGQNIAVKGIQCGKDSVTIHMSPLAIWAYEDAEFERNGKKVVFRSTADGYEDFGLIYKTDLYGNGIPRRYPESIAFEIFVFASAASVVLILLTFGAIVLVRFLCRVIRKIPKPVGTKRLRKLFLVCLIAWGIGVAAIAAIWSWSRPSDETLIREHILEYDDTTRITRLSDDLTPISTESLEKIIDVNGAEGRAYAIREIYDAILRQSDFLINAEELEAVTDSYIVFYRSAAESAGMELEQYLEAIGIRYDFTADLQLYRNRANVYYDAMLARAIAAQVGIDVSETAIAEAIAAGEEPSYVHDRILSETVGEYLLTLAGVS